MIIVNYSAKIIRNKINSYLQLLINNILIDSIIVYAQHRMIIVCCSIGMN